MAIAKTDIKLNEPKRLDDTDIGGGVVTGTEILDGVVNNMFDDISRLDRTLGRVSLRKAFAKIDTATTDKYFGAHLIISEPQSDSGVVVILANTKDDFDERKEAAGKIGSPYDLSLTLEEYIWTVSNVALKGLTEVTVETTIEKMIYPLAAGSFVTTSLETFSVLSVTGNNLKLTGGPELLNLSEGDSISSQGRTWTISGEPEVSASLPVTEIYGDTGWNMYDNASAGDSVFSAVAGLSTILDGYAENTAVTVGSVSATISFIFDLAGKLYFTFPSITGMLNGDTVSSVFSGATFTISEPPGSIDINGFPAITVTPNNWTLAAGDVIRAGANVLTISSVSAGATLYTASVTSSALSANVAAYTDITDNISSVTSGIEVTCDAVIADSDVFPAAGQLFVADGALLSVASVGSSSGLNRTFTVSEPLHEDIAQGSPLQKLPSSTPTVEYSGVSRLAVDASAGESTISLVDSKKKIFPDNSRGLSPELIGLDPKLIPEDNLVSIVDRNRVIVIHSTTEEAITNPAAASTTYPLTGTDFQLIELRDQDDVQVNPALYTVDLVAGSVTMAGAIDLSPYNQPLVAHKRYEDMRLVTAVDHATKVVTLGRPLGQAFTSANTFVSSAVVFGDILSSYGSFFDQVTWTDVWQDTVIGSNAGGTYNDVAYPVEVTNAGCVTERWALEFTSDTNFNIIGQNVGQIGTGVTNAAGGTFTEPLNPETGLPYFKLPQEGWGGGWATGNVLRFNTIGCTKPVWFIRVTQQGDDTLALTDKFTVQIRGDVN